MQIGETRFKIKKTASVQSLALTIYCANGFDNSHFKMQEAYKIGLEFRKRMSPRWHTPDYNYNYIAMF